MRPERSFSPPYKYWPTGLVLVALVVGRHVGLGGQNFAERGQSPQGAPEISPYKITSDFTGFSAGYTGFQRGTELPNTVKARRI
eukprot:scaffold92456_cov63-Cyclotella_meneghiniana.AAC.5